MKDPNANIAAFSTFLKTLNRAQPGPTPLGAPGAGTTGVGTTAGGAAAPAAPADPAAALLSLLAEGPRSLADLLAATGKGPGELIDAIRPLEEYRLLKRVDREDELAFELTAGGRNLIQAAR